MPCNRFWLNLTGSFPAVTNGHYQVSAGGLLAKGDVMNTLRKTAVLLVLISLLVQFVWPPSSISAQGSEGEDLQTSLVRELQDLTNGQARISTHAKTGKVRFIGT